MENTNQKTQETQKQETEKVAKMVNEKAKEMGFDSSRFSFSFLS